MTDDLLAPLGPVEVRKGMSFPSKMDAAEWLRSALDAPGDVVLVEEQRIDAVHRSYVVLTTSHLAVIQTNADEAPQVYVYHPKRIHLQAKTQTQDSTLYIGGAQGNTIQVTRLHPAAAQRIEDAVRLLRVGRLEDPSGIPDQLAFDGIYPIEYYEALLGPDRHRVLQVLDYGGHRYTLDVVTKKRRGYFLVRHYVETPSGWRELESGCRPLRSHQAKLHRDTPPYQVHLVPATREHPAKLLASQGIGTRQAESIRERYVRQVRHTGLEAVLKILEAAGIQAHNEHGYRLVRGQYTRLVVGGKTFTFDSHGNPVTLKSLHRDDHHA